MKDIFWLAEGFEAAGGDDDSGSSNDNNIVSAQDNNIYFYSEVSRPKVLTLNKSLVRVSNSVKNRSSVLQSVDVPINLHICSYGGSVFSGLPLLIILIVVRFLFTRISMAAPLLPLL